MIEGNLFNKYVNLIKNRAWQCFKKTNIDYEDLEAQGFLIYCECLQKYDVSKSNFCTYLYIQLNKLYDFAKTVKRQKGLLINDFENNKLGSLSIYNEIAITQNDNVKLKENIIISPNETISQEKLLEFGKEQLSDFAYRILEWLISRIWEGRYKKTPTIKMASIYFNQSIDIISKYWEECKNFWNNSGKLLYT